MKPEQNMLQDPININFNFYNTLYPSPLFLGKVKKELKNEQTKEKNKLLFSQNYAGGSNLPFPNNAVMATCLIHLFKSNFKKFR